MAPPPSTIKESGISSASSKVSLVHTPASCSPGTSGQATTDPVAISVLPARMVRVSPLSRRVTVSSSGPANRAVPLTSVNLPSSNCPVRYWAKSPIRARFRFLTSAVSTPCHAAFTPNVAACRTFRAALAVSINDLLGMQPRRMQSPPNSLAPSMTTVLNPSPAAVRAAA